MKIYNKYTFSIVMLVAIVEYNYAQQTYKEPEITLDPGATVVWNTDGSVTVKGKATFTSPIKKVGSSYTSDITTSKDMILIDPNFYLSKGYSINETSLNNLSKTHIVNHNYNYEEASTNPVSETSATWPNGRWYIEIDGEGAGAANMKIYKRPPTSFSDPENVLNNDFGFLFEDDWLIYGAQTTTDSNGELFNLDGFVREPLGSFITGASPYKSSDYTELFALWRLGNLKWWKNAVEKHPYQAGYIAGSIAYFFIDPPIALEFDEEGFSLFNSEKTAAEIENLLESNELLEGEKKMTNAKLRKSISAIKRRNPRVFSPRINGKVTINKNAYNHVLSMNANAYVAGINGNSSMYGNFDSSKNTFLNVPDTAEFYETPVEVWNFLGEETYWWTHFNKHKVPCITPKYSSGDISNPNPCTVHYNLPVVVKMEIENATVNYVNFPGLNKEGITPYQMFKNLSYEQESAHSLYSDDRLMSKSANDFFNSLGKSVVQKLPGTIIKKDSQLGTTPYEVTLTFEDNISAFYNFFLISSLDINGIKNLLPLDDNDGDDTDTPDLVKYVDDLGAYTDDGIFHLYKVGISEKSIKLNLNEFTYLSGSEVILRNYEEADLLFVGSDTQTFSTSTELNYKDNNGDPVPPTDKPQTQVVISNAAVSILEDDLIKPDAKTLATDKYGLYVGKVGDAESGILTNNAALLDAYVLPDYVFYEQYKPTPLQDLESFVKENKHLPNVPSQQDYKADGFYSAGQMMMGQLQNLEELYLHTFNQEEKIKALDTKTKAVNQDVKYLEQLINQLENTQ